MSDAKISALPAASAITAADLLPNGEIDVQHIIVTVKEIPVGLS